MTCFLTAFLLLAFIFPGVSSGSTEFRDVSPGDRPEFPKDFYYRKAFKIQWWYFTGHLFDPGGREFGYELTFFAVGVQRRHYRSRFGVNNVYISHFAITDPGTHTFYFIDNAGTGAFGLSGAKDSALKVWVEKAVLEGTPRQMHIKARNKTMSLDLALQPEKPLILHGTHGYSRKSALSPYLASLYFSYTRLKTRGIVQIGAATFRVKGESWFDRELSSREPGEKQSGWDWFSLQLDDGREIMLYLLRNKDGSNDPFSSGTFIYSNGRYRHLSNDDFSVTVTRRYTSKKTGARYPAAWEIRVPSEKTELKVTPLMEDQECIATSTTGNRYWEGASSVRGTASGRAYVELTGY